MRKTQKKQDSGGEAGDKLSKTGKGMRKVRKKQDSGGEADDKVKRGRKGMKKHGRKRIQAVMLIKKPGGI